MSISEVETQAEICPQRLKMPVLLMSTALQQEFAHFVHQLQRQSLTRVHSVHLSYTIFKNSHESC